MTAASATTRGSFYRRDAALFFFVVGLALVGAIYWHTFQSIVQKWAGDAAFSHGFLILPLAAWLAWRERARLVAVELAPSTWGVLATAACTLAWMVAKATGVLVIEQFAAVAMVPALVLAAFGWPVIRILWFPLLFLFFAVPFGRAFVPVLMQVTADFATLLLQWSGVPVFRSHMLISIPAGNFEVARACSGLNYLITSFVLGVLYAYLNFRDWRKRLLCVMAFIVIPVVLNGLRVYFTILVSHWTDMRYGPGYEHVTFGRIFFVVIILLLFWVGRRWHDHDEVGSAARRKVAGSAGLRRAPWPLAVACVVALIGPWLLEASVSHANSALANPSALARMPAPAGSWQGPLAQVDEETWRPLYHGGIVEEQARFRAPDGASVDVFVAVYGLGRTQGAEMISYSNIIATNERKSLASEVTRRIESDGHQIEVRELKLNHGPAGRLVWYWYVVGDHAATGTFATKALEAAMVLTRGATSERIVVLSTAADADARARLTQFVQDHAACVAAGFQGEACGP